MSSFIVFFKSVLDDALSKSAEYHGVKNDIDDVLYKVLDASLKVVGSARTSDAGVAVLDEFQGLLHGVDMDYRSFSNFIVITAVVEQKDTLPILYSYEFRSTSITGVPETLGDMSTCGVNVRGVQAMKTFGYKSNKLSSENKSK